jgi:hypothetical protein
MLIRKGGIREDKPDFEVPSNQILFFPTFEHQALQVLRSEYRERL